MKKCTKCNETKELSCFYKQKAGKFGVDSRCKICSNKYRSEWCKKNRDKKRLIERNYAAKHPEMFRKKALKRYYNISISDYEKMAEAQNNVCKICKNPEDRRNYLCVDHDHITGKIRGLLCNNCNRALGLLKDNTDILENAFNYLKSNSNIEKR